MEKLEAKEIQSGIQTQLQQQLRLDLSKRSSQSSAFRFSDDQDELQKEPEKKPNCIQLSQIQQFIALNSISESKYGFVYLQLNKNVFFPNQVVVANIIVYVQKPLPRSRVYLQLKGYEKGVQENPGPPVLQQIIGHKRSTAQTIFTNGSLLSKTNDLADITKVSTPSKILVTPFSLHQHYKSEHEISPFDRQLFKDQDKQQKSSKNGKKYELNKSNTKSDKKKKNEVDEPFASLERRNSSKDSQKLHHSFSEISGHKNALAVPQIRKSSTTIRREESVSNIKRALDIVNDAKSVKSLGNDQHHKAAAIMRAEKRNKEKSNKLILFDFKLPVFEFRQKKIQEGIYCIPISFRLPMFIPGSFQFSKGHSTYKIGYTAKTIIEEFEANYSEKVQKYGKNEERKGGQYSEFKLQHLMTDKREIFVRQFIFTNEQVAQLQERKELHFKKQEAEKPGKRNIVKQTIDKRYNHLLSGQLYDRNYSSSKMAPASLSNQTTATQGLKKLNTKSLLQDNQFLQGGDWFSHEMTGYSNLVQDRVFRLKIKRCRCIPTRFHLNLQVSVNQFIFEPQDTIQVKIAFENDSQELFKIVDQVEVCLVQRITLFSDVKKLHQKTYNHDIAKVTYKKENPSSKYSLQISFKLDKLFSFDRRFPFVNKNLKLEQKIPHVEMRLNTIDEKHESNFRMGSLQKQDEKKNDQIGKDNEDNDLLGQKKEDGEVKQLGKSEEVERRKPDHIRKIEQLNLTTIGHILKNQFLVSVNIKAKEYFLDCNGQVEIPVKIREKKTDVLMPKMQRPALPPTLQRLNNVFIMSGAAMRLDEKYISVDSLMLQSSLKFLRGKG